MTLSEFKEIDKTFNESMFLTKINNIFIKLFSSIMMDRLTEIDHFVGDEVYKYAEEILNNAKSKGLRQVYDELNVKDSRITNVIVNDDNYIIEVLLNARYMDYYINLDTGDYVSGNNEYRIQVDYKLTFVKSRTAKQQGIVRKCPKCGASLDVNNSGKCKYCHSIYNQEDYDWVLEKIETI